MHFDWNSDGKRDLIVENGEGKAVYFDNAGTDTGPVFTSGINLQACYSTLYVGQNSHPFAVDWNNDNKDDLVIGASDGQIRLFLNVGPRTQSLLSSGEILQAGYEPISPGYDSKPRVTDWKGDGKKDLLIGTGRWYGED